MNSLSNALVLYKSVAKISIGYVIDFWFRIDPRRIVKIGMNEKDQFYEEFRKTASEITSAKRSVPPSLESTKQ